MTGPVATDPSGTDPFGTAALRGAALAAWRTSPTRLREDANLEEDHGRGYYRDRVVIELAQNAADAAGAAAEAGEGRSETPARLDLRLVESDGRSWLVAENTGSPLTPAGVASLASLRASTKVSQASRTVGRFGVGFAAVRSVSDEITVLTRGPAGVDGVAFSLRLTRELLTSEAHLPPAAAARVAERGAALPVLRLPFPASDHARDADAPHAHAPSERAATAVVLELRDEDAVRAVRAQLDALDEVILLALGSLDVISVEVDGITRALDRSVFGPAGGWTVRTMYGSASAAALAERPVEERGEARWSVTWAVPPAGGSSAGVRAGIGAGGVVHAPTPTADPLGIGGVLVATFPLDPTRRHVVDGLLAREIAEAAGRSFSDVVAERAQALGTDALVLVPVGAPMGWVDAVVRDAALDAMRAAPLFDGTAARDALAIDGPVGADRAVVDALRPVVHGLVTLPPQARAAARRLGLEVRGLADAVDDLAPAMPPSGWFRAFDALARHADDRDVREALSTLPVPVVRRGGGSPTASPDAPDAGQRGTAVPMVRGPRGVVVPGVAGAAGAGSRPGVDPGLEALVRWGVPAVHPDAAHPLLERLGALAADDPAVLELPAARAAVARAAEGADDDDAFDGDVTDDGPDARARDVLAVVQAVVRAHPHARLPDALGTVLLPSADRDTLAGLAPQPAADLALPGTWAASLLDLDVVASESASAWDQETFLAFGVHAGLGVTPVRDVVLPGPDDDAPLEDSVLDVVGDDVLDYLDDLTVQLGAGTLVEDLDLVAPLDAVPEDASVEDVIAHALSEPALRAALVQRVRAAAHRGGPGPGDAPSHLAWWLRRRLGSPLRLTGVIADPDDRATETGGVLPAAPVDVTRVVRDGSGGNLADVWRALGVVARAHDLEGLDDDLVAAAPDRLPDVGVRVGMADALAWWRFVGAAASRGTVWDPAPERVVALVRDERGTRALVCDADDVAVAGEPSVASDRPVLPAPPQVADDVADALDLPRAAPPDGVQWPEPDEGPDASRDAGNLVPVPEEALGALTVLAPGVAISETYVEHDRLVVDGADVEWWVEPGERPIVHAATTAGLARGLAWAAGAPHLRHVLGEVLADPSRADELLAESAWD